VAIKTHSSSICPNIQAGSNYTEHAQECVKWGGKITALRLQLAKNLEDLAAYLRSAEMQRLLQKGDSYSKVPALSDKRPELYELGAAGARSWAVKSASDMLVDIENLEYAADPTYTNNTHDMRIKNAIGNIGSSLLAVQQQVQEILGVSKSIQFTVQQTGTDVSKNLQVIADVLTVATETRNFLEARDQPENIKQRQEENRKNVFDACTTALVAWSAPHASLTDVTKGVAEKKSFVFPVYNAMTQGGST